MYQYQVLAVKTAQGRCFWVEPYRSPHWRRIRIGLLRNSEQEAWEAAHKAAAAHLRKAHRGGKRILIKEWVGELGTEAWVVRKEDQ